MQVFTRLMIKDSIGYHHTPVSMDIRLVGSMCSVHQVQWCISIIPSLGRWKNSEVQAIPADRRSYLKRGVGYKIANVGDCVDKRKFSFIFARNAILEKADVK